MSDYLPKELMIDIFTRLPIKSILQCRSVCRSWYSLINSPNFISAHLNQSTNDYILIRPYSIVPKVEIYALFHKNENLDQDIQFDFPFDCSNFYFIIVEIMLLSSLTNESRSNYDELFLFVSEESLCMVDNNYDKSKPIDIWMLREYGASDSWVKQFSIKYYHVVGNMPLREHIF
ncbi:uncharacterized protein LOC124892305 [Capsicum annuum]|uniref:uncharacterized protein LOC124892305 n=1 Tax=Capsicum annuum TaxID=4072 RepID=UPI001FB0ADB2|nr:uncharacterized protein LOC124892305 [Capsicum annuum]